MYKKALTLALTYLLLPLGIQPKQILTSAQEQVQALLPQLQKMAQQATHLALESEPKSDRYRQLVSISSICLHAIESFHNTPTEKLEALFNIISTELSGFTSVGIRSPGEADDIEPVALPIEEIVALISEEHLEIHFKPTSNQLTAKRIIFRTIVELFNSFGSSKLRAQKEARQEEREKNKPQKEKGRLTFKKKIYRVGKNCKTELYDNRSGFALRTLRILANRFIDKTIPNKNRTKAQKFAELLIPIVCANIISFFISKDRNEKWSHLTSNIAENVLVRLIMVQLFIEKKNVAWILLMVATYLLSFYNSTASRQLWEDEFKENEQYNAFTRRTHFMSRIAHDPNKAINVFVDGASQIALYHLIDQVIMPKITIPRWLLTVPVCQKQSEHHEHIFPPVTQPNGKS